MSFVGSVEEQVACLYSRCSCLLFPCLGYSAELRVCAGIHGVQFRWGKYTFHEFDMKLFFCDKNTKSMKIQIYKVMFFILF
jgi:hypothetical protein